MKSRSNYSHRSSEAAGANGWHGLRRRVLAMGMAVLFAFYPLTPVGASPAAAGASATLPAASSAFPGSAGGCQLNSRRGKIQHVVTIIFDNTHFKRDPARDGSTLVPSDIEQMPHLLNFIKNNGVLLTNHHTQLIAHTSDDILTILTGVYPERHGVANAANSYQYYKSTGGTGFQSAFTYWTDTIGDGAYNLISGPIDSTHPNGVNAPAPWVPFTRAGCDVGAVAAADMEIENTGADLTTIFGNNVPPSTDRFADFEGV